MAFLDNDQKSWCADHEGEALELLRTLGKIPAPSHHEDKRAQFVRDWLAANGAEGVYIDEAKNVIYPIGVTGNNPVAVVMAHTDIVFPDTGALAMREEAGKLFAPGIGDDTANLVNLMMAAKYIAENRPASKTGLLIVANSCEEGLGNLKGSRQIMKDFEGRVSELISLDGGPDWIVNDAVGSCRMKITIRAQGGHSFGDFGNTNAIVQMAELIRRLYEKEPPKQAKTTYNIGVIEGGTTVNSICAECSALYEYRSEDRECLAEMDAFFAGVIDEFRKNGVDISVEVLGVRPCKGDVDAEKLNALTARAAGIIKEFTGRDS
jgi:acetylornithine deacetylase/succinyl-diaminopimelate desuccinylase-like protein